MKIDNLKIMAAIGITQKPTKTKAFNALSEILESLPCDHEYMDDNWRIIYNYIANVGTSTTCIKCPFKYGQKFIDKNNVNFRDVLILDGYLYATNDHIFFKYKIDRENGYYDKHDVKLRDVNDTGTKWAKTINEIIDKVLIPENIQSNIDYEFVRDDKCVQYPWHDDNCRESVINGAIYKFEQIKKLKQFKPLGKTHYWNAIDKLLIVGDHDCMVGIMSIA